MRTWRDEKTQESARALWNLNYWWGGVGHYDVAVEESLSAGDIGWIGGNVWHPIPLVHQIPVAASQEYQVIVHQFRDGEWKAIEQTQIDGFTRSGTQSSTSLAQSLQVANQILTGRVDLPWYAGSIIPHRSHEEFLFWLRTVTCRTAEDRRSFVALR